MNVPDIQRASVSPVPCKGPPFAPSWPVVRARAVRWAALIGLTACGGSSVPASPSAPALPVASQTGTGATPQAERSVLPPNESTPPTRESPVPPAEFAVGDKRVVLRFYAGASARSSFVASIAVGSERVFPPPCDAPAPPASGLCSPGHLELRSVRGKGKDLELVGTHVRGQQLDLLFAAVFEGSPECGAYGYWLLQVGPTGARATSPILGCMATPVAEGPDREVPNPMIQWGPPVSIRFGEEGGGWRRWELNSRTFQWTQVGRGGDAL